MLTSFSRGLSATIGSPENFNSWLQSVQEAHGYRHRFIQYPHRYSHLRKFYYTLTESPSFQGLISHKPTERNRFLHPVSESLLSFGARVLPPDLALEAGDLLSLYHALVAHQVTGVPDMTRLEPATFFHSKSHLLRQKDVLEYEVEIKNVLSTLITTFDVREQSFPLYNVVHGLEDPKLASKMNELPAILFNFSRSDCEIMAKAIISSLEAAEKKWRSSSPEWQRKLRDWEHWKSRSKERERLAERAKRQKKGGDEGGPAAVDYSWEGTFNPDDPSEDFSFAGTHTVYSKADLDEDVYEMTRWTSTESWALDALKRGIAVHHAGMNKHYRSLVERLFRQGFVRVVIATGTLALGINAPTKTSVFCGDSPFLTALMYRQCAGRAGRRGYDLLGNVVFYGLTLDRVQRLVLSKLPNLGGNFPLTSTLTLRLLNLLEGSNYAEVAVKAIKSLMSLPHITFGSDEGRHQLLHYLRFSIEFLRRSRLLDREGKPMNLFAIAAHLYYTEPSNFALITLLQNGVLHSICRQSSLVYAQKDFMMLMAHLFGRRYLSRIYFNKDNIAQLSKKYPSLIILPPLPKAIQDIMASHDKEILDIFVGYAVSFATEHAETLGSDSSLPISHIDYSADHATNSTSTFRTYLKDNAIVTTARSQFAANSGHDDEFKSARELAHTAREGLYLNEYAIPSLSQFISSGHDKQVEGDGLEHCLNAYIYDFYIHGQVAALAAANGIRRGDVWYLLQDFTLTLMTIKSSLEQLLVKASQGTRDTSMPTAENELAETDIDSGYGTFDPAEAEREPEDGADDGNEGIMGFRRPNGVTDADWRIYEVVSGATAVFEGKFKAMWA
ncbi:hypothetical protein Hypma_005062 [Hypsizygus marmoreus]|uniref:Helicase C-terminal domain-containing protein n=1 Tax=Hypsizygus marmoreus TaxID=39966 RepID=A0A369K5H8_HYPMA|nr:hypothetical protein Hypma_005062 [Hypsizygus marmoreus]